MAFTKITENDTINKGVIGLPDTPNLSTSEMQAKFEELSNDVIIPKFNNLVDELEAKSAAGNIGATIPSGINAESENVQAVLNGIAEKAHTHEKSDAELTDAVTKAHEHSNKSVIDKFTENESGVPLYNGGKMTGDAFKKVKVGDKYITAEDYDTIEIVAGDNVVIDADTENKTLKISAIGGSGGGGGDMYKAVYDKDNDGMVDNAKTVGSLDNLNTTNQENVVNAINEVIADRQIKTYLSPTLMDSTKNWTNYELKDLKAGRCLMASLSETTDISNAYTNGVIPVQKAGTLKGINVNNNGFYQYFTIDGEQYINSCSNFVANTFTGWNKFDVDTLTTLEQVTASTDVSKPVGAGAVQELNSSLTANDNQFYFDYQDGKYGYNTDPNRGADTFSPFSNGGLNYGIINVDSSKFNTDIIVHSVNLGYKPTMVCIVTTTSSDFSSIVDWIYCFDLNSTKYYYDHRLVNFGGDPNAHGLMINSITDTGFSVKLLRPLAINKNYYWVAGNKTV